jgi:hypothetical protein
MFKKVLLAAASVSVFASPAQAATFVTALGSNATFAAPAGDNTTTFDGGSLGAGFTLTGGSVVMGSLAGSYAQPAFSDGSQYLAVLGGTTAVLQSLTGYNSVSLFLGSIDTYNTIDLLDTAGGVIQSFQGFQFTAPANGDQSIPQTNRRITFTRDGSDASIGGVRFGSTYNSLETDNIVFAVPEPATWMMMIAGFALIGFATRSRRRKAVTSVLA